MSEQKSEPIELERQKKEVQDSFSFKEPNILLSKRLQNPTLYQVEQYLLLAKELVQKHGCSYLIIDARESAATTPASRALAKKYLAESSSLIEHIILVVRNPFFMMGVRFVVSVISLQCKVSAVRTIEEALEIAQKETLS